MLKFNEYLVDDKLTYRVTIPSDPQSFTHTIFVATLAPTMMGNTYWAEFSDVCVYLEELEEIVAKLKELNNADQRHP